MKGNRTEVLKVRSPKPETVIVDDLVPRTLRVRDTKEFRAFTRRRSGLVRMLREIKQQAAEQGINWQALVGDV